MTTERIQLCAGLLIAAVRDLQLAVCAARSDGPQIAERFAQGRTRVTLDDTARQIEFVIVTADGSPDFVEIVTSDYDRPETWGALGSLGVGAGATQH